MEEESAREQLERIRAERRKRRESESGGITEGSGTGGETIRRSDEQSNSRRDKRITQTSRQSERNSEPTRIEITNSGGENGSKGFEERGGTGTKRSIETGPSEGRKERKTTKAEAKSLDINLVDEDRQDIINLVVGLGGNIANLTHFDGFQITEAEADTIALPAARILARHGLTEEVRKVSDPFLLLTAIGTIVGPRMAAYKIWIQFMREQQQIQLQQLRNQNGNVENGPTVSERFTGFKVN